MTYQELQERIEELEKQLRKITDERDSYRNQYKYLSEKWHPSTGRKPIYTDGTAAGLLIEHYYQGHTIRQIMADHNMANATVQRLIRKQLMEMVDDFSAGRMNISKVPDHRKVEIGMLRKVLNNKWYTGDYMKDNIISLLDKEDGDHDKQHIGQN